MKTILAIILLASTAHAQSFVVTERATVGFVVTDRDEALSPAVTPARAPPPATVERFLISESWCRYCPAAKAKFLSSGGKPENIITIAQARDRHGQNPASIPFEFTATVQRALAGQFPEQNTTAGASGCSCSSACTCGCQSGGVCKCGKTVAQPQRSQQQGVEYGGRIYTGRVCSNPNCKMCNQIQRSLQSIPPQASISPAQEGTPHDTIRRMLDAMQLSDRDTLADLGCGDGRILVEAGRRGLHCIGIEIDPAKAEEARRNVAVAGLSHLVTIETGDARDFDTTRCSAITAYLYPELLAELAPKLRAVRVAASPFHEVEGFTPHGDVWIHRKNENKVVVR